jgi:FkbM family methyltransferase
VGVASTVMGWTPTRVLVPAVAWQYRFFEPELRRIEEFVPRDRGAVDAGVWWGPWSWWLARRVPRVDSFEPNPDLVARLTPVLPKNVFLHPVALSDRSGSSDLWIPDRGMGTEGRASLEAVTAQGSNWKTQKVETKRLDDFDLGDVGFVKIDVEGHELAALKGASNLISEQRPNILIEIEEHAHRDGQMDAIIEFLHERSYQGTYLHHGTWHPMEELDRALMHQMANRVAKHGYAFGLAFYARKYVHNFLFRSI